MSDADGVGHLDLATLGQAGSDDVLGDVTTGVGGRTVNLRWVLAGECTATVTGHSAVGVHDDLAAGQTAVAYRATDDEVAGRVDVELGVLVQQVRRDDVLDDQIHHAFAQVLVRHIRVVLGRQDDGVDADHLAVFVTAGNLGFGIRAQPRQQAGFTRFGLTLHQLVGEGDRRWHQHVGLVAGIAEHQALVASTLIFRFAAVNALGDVYRLLADDVHHATGGAVETDVGAVVADVEDDITHDVFQIDPGRSRHFASDDRHTGLDQCFARYTCVFVFSDDGVQNRVGNLVGDLVRMPFGHGLGGEK
ncbi:hypothetical protein ALP24_05656 [Pseudomonas syringae pv. aptata]|uniref:Uncharacterized protein n=1 Tax=Pseudomonas syringae pv. aptata TaxID=83167 RepID=A0A3M5WQ54_PSEAP|nr:hypothetical protein ALP24_05656 [Pseudomonas syringae pv. aptata]